MVSLAHVMLSPASSHAYSLWLLSHQAVQWALGQAGSREELAGSTGRGRLGSDPLPSSQCWAWAGKPRCLSSPRAVTAGVGDGFHMLGYLPDW